MKRIHSVKSQKMKRVTNNHALSSMDNNEYRVPLTGTIMWKDRR